MKKFYASLSVVFFFMSQNAPAMEKFRFIHIGDINECHVRTAQVQDHMVWEVNDPKYDASDEFNSLTTQAYDLQDKGFAITSMVFSATNNSKIRALNAFFNALTIGNKPLSTVVYVWVNDAEAPYFETLLGELLITRFGFGVIDNAMIENFTPQTLGKGGFLKGTFGDISKNIIR